MAYKIYPDKTNTDAPSSMYPDGKIRDDDGTGSGTPVDTKVYGDMHQFFAKLMSLAGLVFNSLPDNAYYGYQYVTALLTIIVNSFVAGVQATFYPDSGPNTTVNLKTIVLEIGDWDMDTNATTNPIVTQVSAASIRSIDAIIRDDGGSVISNLMIVDASCILQGGITSSLTGSFSLRRLTGGTFDSSSYNSTGYNRGWVTIVYEA